MTDFSRSHALELDKQDPLASFRERFIITDRGTPVGELVPHRSSMTVIDRMIAEGRAIPATRRIGLGFTPTGNVSTDVSDELLKMRDEERQI